VIDGDRRRYGGAIRLRGLEHARLIIDSSALREAERTDVAVGDEHRRGARRIRRHRIVQISLRQVSTLQKNSRRMPQQIYIENVYEKITGRRDKYQSRPTDIWSRNSCSHTPDQHHEFSIFRRGICCISRHTGVNAISALQRYEWSHFGLPLNELGRILLRDEPCS